MWKKLTILICLAFCNIYAEEIKFLDSTWVKQKTEPFIYTISDFYTPKENLNLNLSLIVEKDSENLSVDTIIDIAKKDKWENSGTRKHKNGTIIILTKFDYKVGKIIIGFSESINNTRTTYWVKKEDNNLYAKRSITEWLNKYIKIMLYELPKIQSIQEESDNILTKHNYELALNDPIRIAVFSDLKSEDTSNKKELNILVISTITSIIFIIFIAITTIFIKIKLKRENEE